MHYDSYIQQHFGPQGDYLYGGARKRCVQATVFPRRARPSTIHTMSKEKEGGDGTSP